MLAKCKMCWESALDKYSLFCLLLPRLFVYRCHFRRPLNCSRIKNCNTYSYNKNVDITLTGLNSDDRSKKVIVNDTPYGCMMIRFTKVLWRQSKRHEFMSKVYSLLHNMLLLPKRHRSNCPLQYGEVLIRSVHNRSDESRSKYYGT